MKIFLALLAFIFLHTSGECQLKPQFSSQNYVGILEGQSETALQLQTINGLRYRGWFAGAGVGLDYYYFRSIPVFFSISKFLESTKVPLYFSGDIGLNFPWEKNGVYYFRDPGEISSGLYWSGGAGYKFGFRKSGKAVLLNLGYNHKRLVSVSERMHPCLVPPCPTYKETYDYRLRRLSVRVGFMF